MRKKIALVHSGFQNTTKLGGTEVLALHVIEALKNKYDLTLISIFSDSFLKDLDRINSLYGIDLQADDIRFHDVKHKTLPYLRDHSWGLRFHAIMREARSVADDFDLMFSTQNEMDLLKPGLQYIHYPVYGPSLEPPSVWQFLKRPYRQFLARFYGYDPARMKKNLTMANSAWTASVFKSTYGLDAKVVYPPVWRDEKVVPWREKKDAFVMIGRVAPEKRTDLAIRILSRVREKGHPITFHIVGREYDHRYGYHIRELISPLDWITWHQDLDQAGLRRLVSESRYGIHGMRKEHFGMSVAEMTCAGALVFVHDSGGQREIVAEEPLLLYQNEEDAVDKIVQVLENPDQQQKLVERLAPQSLRFSVENFWKDIKQAVAARLEA